MHEARIHTLGDLKRNQHRLYANCCNIVCAHGKPLDLDILIARFGQDHVVINDTEIKRRLTCENCRSAHGAMLTIIPPGKITL